MRIACMLAIAGLNVAPAIALANPWVGTWSLDPSKSTYSPGPAHRSATIVVTDTGAGKLNYVTNITDGSGEADHSEFTCSIGAGECQVLHAGAKQTVSITRNGRRGLKLHWKFNDSRPFSVVMVVKLSSDGNTQVATSKGTLPDGSELAVTETWHKSSGR